MALASLPVQTTTRRSGNYQPSIWSYEYIQSLSSNYVGESFAKRAEKLKEEVRTILIDPVADTLDQLELIDTLHRLGVSYHFQDEIRGILNIIHVNNHCNYKRKQDSLFGIALEFRLLRHYGFDVSAEIISNFRDDKGSVNPRPDDCKGILYLYEAAYLLEEKEESIFHDVRDFTTTYLKEYVKLKHNKDEYLSSLVSHALEIPLHWRVPRLEARWFIDIYKISKDMIPFLLEFAKLDFNIVQARHQEELKDLSRWWRNTNLVDQLSFARDRLMESFFWSAGLLCEPQFGYFRKICTKITALITLIDDSYDVYGTLEEVELFTDAVERWDVSAMDQLPQYMRILFLALHNCINEIAFDALKERGVQIIPYLKKAWADFCKSYLLEAKWYHSGYIPTFRDYMENGWISIAVPVTMVHFYCFNPTIKEGFECYKEYHNFIRCISLVGRYEDDLGTSPAEMKRGDVPKSIQCYMHESGASEEDARKHIRELITSTWLKINKERGAGNNSFIEFGRNTARLTVCLYQHGDGFGNNEDCKTKDQVLSLFVHPIPVTENDQQKSG